MLSQTPATHVWLVVGYSCHRDIHLLVVGQLVKSSMYVFHHFKLE